MQGDEIEKAAEAICRHHALWNPSGKPSVYYTDLVAALTAAEARGYERGMKDKPTSYHQGFEACREEAAKECKVWFRQSPEYRSHPDALIEAIRSLKP